ncbi:MAG: HAD hydrolase family protein, partial [Clostridia bacterium]|nr:HAD hydrolase family protein [Clostridia bacterium]
MKDAKGLIIVTDLDGTLLDGDGKVPERNLRGIDRFKAAGG